MAENQESFLSGRPARAEERSLTPWILAGAVVVVIVGVLVAVSLMARKPAAGDTADPYAAQLALSGIQMSQSSNGVGSQITYIDGEIANHGDRIVDGVTVRTTFRDSMNQPGQQESMPMSLIRTREPYIDTEPVSAEPIRPGQSRSFRLIFDHVSQEWNQQNPDIRVLQVHFR